MTSPAASRQGRPSRLRRDFAPSHAQAGSRHNDIRTATPDEGEVLVGHCLKIWDSYGTPP
ncbi:hypothetical protein BS630_26215 [Rhizobium laguerreae]|nr:hypothetical protein BS630_26215 [Rhizobium laguerreae]